MYNIFGHWLSFIEAPGQPREWANGQESGWVTLDKSLHSSKPSSVKSTNSNSATQWVTLANSQHQVSEEAKGICFSGCPHHSILWLRQGTHTNVYRSNLVVAMREMTLVMLGNEQTEMADSQLQLITMPDISFSSVFTCWRLIWIVTKFRIGQRL